MENSMHLVEMVNSTNYAAMSYRELVTLNFAFLLAIGEIKPLMNNKRAEEMNTHTNEYVAKMNSYGASKAEILDCLEKRVLRDEPSGPLASQDVDDQTPTVEAEYDQDKGEDMLALPEFNVSVSDKEEANGAKDALLADQQEDTVKEDLNSVVTTAEIETTPPSVLVDAVIEIAKEGRIPDYIDVNAPYFVEYTIKYDNDGKLWREGT